MLETVELMYAVPLLAVASLFDVVRRRIPNAITVATFLAGTAASWSRGGIAAAASAVGAAVLVGAVLMPVWRMRALGGGDLKLASACAAWVRLEHLASFGLAAAVSGGVVALACFALSSAKARREIAVNLRLATMRAMPDAPIAQVGGRVSVPYGAAVALAAVWTLAGG